jgi:hypothetical protein
LATPGAGAVRLLRAAELAGLAPVELVASTALSPGVDRAAAAKRAAAVESGAAVPGWNTTTRPTLTAIAQSSGIRG